MLEDRIGVMKGMLMGIGIRLWIIPIRNRGRRGFYSMLPRLGLFRRLYYLNQSKKRMNRVGEFMFILALSGSEVITVFLIVWNGSGEDGDADSPSLVDSGRN